MGEPAAKQAQADQQGLLPAICGCGNSPQQRKPFFPRSDSCSSLVQEEERALVEGAVFGRGKGNSR